MGNSLLVMGRFSLFEGFGGGEICYLYDCLNVLDAWVGFGWSWVLCMVLEGGGGGWNICMDDQPSIYNSFSIAILPYHNWISSFVNSG